MAAYLTVKITLSAALKSTSLTSTAIKVATAVEDELRLAAFEEREVGLYHLIDRRMRERGASSDRARAVFIYTANKFKMPLPSFTRSQKTHLGTKLIELFETSTGLVRLQNVRTDKRKTVYLIRPGEGVDQWIEDQNIRAELFRPYYLPTVIPPRPWNGLWGGGYHTSALMPQPLVKQSSKRQLALLEKADLSWVYESINAIQDTEWRINAPVLDTMAEVWRRGLDIGMPSKYDIPIPAKPANMPPRGEQGTEEQNKNRKEWKTAAKRTHEKNVSTRAKRLSIEMMLTIAQTLKDEPAIYFPHQLDFRGRAYAVPIALNPQGPDHARALLTGSQARGKPIDTPRAAGWLAIHGANLWGFDKVSLSDRIAWAEEHATRIQAVALDPLSDLWWTEADGGKKAWSFLAWCFEYAAFLEHGFGYVSSLPLAVDGSCNGLQHFSAMLRDPIGGAATNLIPSEVPSDIYQKVADDVVERLPEEPDPAKVWIAQNWKTFGINRKLTKRPVMVLPYGGTFRSCLQYVRDGVNDRLVAGESNPFGDQLKEATSYLSQCVWHSIGNVVVAARSAMGWLQDVARAATKHGHALDWVTPSGFHAYQGYRAVKHRRVKTRIHGSLLFLSTVQDSDKLDARKQALGVSPNFVHSMDAAAMTLTIVLAKHNGVSQFAMIHDSYGSVAADMDMLVACLREAFVDMYLDHNVLEELLRGLPPEVQADCPPIPPMGTLDIKGVLDSDFFFA